MPLCLTSYEYNKEESVCLLGNNGYSESIAFFAELCIISRRRVPEGRTVMLGEDKEPGSTIAALVTTQIATHDVRFAVQSSFYFGRIDVIRTLKTNFTAFCV